jgi:hypothetical protein
MIKFNLLQLEYFLSYNDYTICSTIKQGEKLF